MFFPNLFCTPAGQQRKDYRENESSRRRKHCSQVKPKRRLVPADRRHQEYRCDGEESRCEQSQCYSQEYGVRAASSFCHRSNGSCEGNRGARHLPFALDWCIRVLPCCAGREILCQQDHTRQMDG